MRLKIFSAAHSGKCVLQDPTDISCFIEIINDWVKADAQRLRCPAGYDTHERKMASLKWSRTTFAFIRYHSHAFPWHQTDSALDDTAVMALDQAGGRKATRFACSLYRGSAGLPCHVRLALDARAIVSQGSASLHWEGVAEISEEPLLATQPGAQYVGFSLGWQQVASIHHVLQWWRESWHWAEIEALTDVHANERDNLCAIDWILFRRNYSAAW